MVPPLIPFKSSKDLPESTESTTNTVKATIATHLANADPQPSLDKLLPSIVSLLYQAQLPLAYYLN